MFMLIPRLIVWCLGPSNLCNWIAESYWNGQISLVQGKQREIAHLNAVGWGDYDGYYDQGLMTLGAKKGQS